MLSRLTHYLEVLAKRLHNTSRCRSFTCLSCNPMHSGAIVRSAVICCLLFWYGVFCFGMVSTAVVWCLLLCYGVYCCGMVSTALLWCLLLSLLPHQNIQFMSCLMAMTRQCGHFHLQLAFVPLMSSTAMFHCLQWGELSKRPQAGAGGMPDLALQLRVSKNALRSPASQEEIVSQVCSLFCQLLPTDLLCHGAPSTCHSSKTPCSAAFCLCAAVAR